MLETTNDKVSGHDLCYPSKEIQWIGYGHPTITDGNPYSLAYIGLYRHFTDFCDHRPFFMAHIIPDLKPQDTKYIHLGDFTNQS